MRSPKYVSSGVQDGTNQVRFVDKVNGRKHISHGIHVLAINFIMKRVAKLQIYFEGISVLAINFIIKRVAKPVQIRSGLLIKLMAGTTFSGANVSYPHAPPAVGREGGGTLNGRSRARSPSCPCAKVARLTKLRRVQWCSVWRGRRLQG